MTIISHINTTAALLVFGMGWHLNAKGQQAPDASPGIEISPTELDVEVEEGSSTTVPITISNTGNAVLDWWIYMDQSPSGGYPGEVIREIRIPYEEGARSWGVAFDGSSLSVSRGYNSTTLYAIDPQDGHIIRSLDVSEIGTGIEGLAWDGEKLWVAFGGAGKICAVDINTGQALKTFETLSTLYWTPFGIVFGDGHLWVSNYFHADTPSQNIYKIDPEDGTILDTITIDRRINDLVWQNGALWVSKFYENDSMWIFRVDPSDGSQQIFFELPDRNVKGHCLSGDQQHIWVADGSVNRLYLISMGRGVFQPEFGSLAAGGSQTVNVTFGTEGLSVGPHTALLGIKSNDPDMPAVEVPVTLTVTPGVDSIRLTVTDPIELPPFAEGASPTSAEAGVTISNGTGAETWAAVLSNGPFSITGGTGTGDGNFTVEAESGLALGTYTGTVEVTSDQVADSAIASVTLVVSGLGDVNTDGSVGMADLNLTVDFILGRIVLPGTGKPSFSSENADVNGDGVVNMADLNLLVDYILGRITKFP